MNQLWHIADSPPCHRKPFNVQNSFCDGTKLAMYFIVSSLFPISLHWCPTGNDGLQTAYWNSLHVFPYSGCYRECVEVQLSVTQREESFLSLFPYLSNSRTLLGGENGGPGLSEYTETVHWGSWSSLFRDPWTSIHNTHKQRFTINMQMMCFGNIICFQRVNSVICITLNFFIWAGLLDCHCSSAKKSWMDILDALINFLMLKTPQIQPC